MCASFLTAPLLQCAYIIVLLDKKPGDKTTLKEFLQLYRITEELKTEYKNCNKEVLLKEFHNLRQMKESVPMKVVNISVSKSVSRKLDYITSNVCSFYFLDKYLTPL